MTRTPIGGITASAIQNATYTYAADAAVSDTYAITLSPAPSAYADGQQFTFKANTANTGAATLNVNSLGAKTIKKLHDQDLATGDIEAASIVTVVYNSTGDVFEMTSSVQQAAATGSTPRLVRSNIFELAPSTTTSLPYYYTAATGTVTTSSGGWLLSTGTTSGSSVRVTLKQNWTGDGLTGWDKNPEIIFVQSAPNPTTTGDAVMQVTLGDNGSEGTSAGVLTAKHMGFIFGIVSGVVTVWASNANGSTQTKTDVTASWTGGQTGIFRATMTSGTNIKFYIDGVLVATHTTNNPTGALSVTSSIYNDLDAGNISNNGMEIASYVFSVDA